MAFVNLTPGTVNMSMRAIAKANAVSNVIKDSTGTAVDFTTWESPLAIILGPASPTPGNPGVDGSGFIAPTGNADGTISLLSTVDAMSNLGTNGTALITILGKKTSGDDNQLLATGTLSVSNVGSWV